MGWQKTFSLSKRSKGCHLVTDEVLTNIQAGLQDVQASTFPFSLQARCWWSLGICKNDVHTLGRDVIPLYVGLLRLCKPAVLIFRGSRVNTHRLPWPWTRIMTRVSGSVCAQVCQRSYDIHFHRDVRRGRLSFWLAKVDIPEVFDRYGYGFGQHRPRELQLASHRWRTRVRMLLQMRDIMILKSEWNCFTMISDSWVRRFARLMFYG